MSASNGMVARLENLTNEVSRLWREKATNERVDAISRDIEDLVKSVDALRASFGDLMKAILVACVVWALGSAGFLVGVLALTH